MEDKSTCEYCNKKFNNPKAKASHQHHCSEYIKIKNLAEEEWKKTKHYCPICGIEIIKFNFLKNKLNTCENKNCIKQALSKQRSEKSKKEQNDPEFRKKLEQKNIEKYGVPYPQSLQSVKDKAKKTCQKKYGGDASTCSAEVRKKSKQTCIEKYGVDNPQKCEEIKNKTKQTNIEKYGTEYTFQAESVKEKIKQTEIERYGSNRQNNPEIKEKIRKTNQERYGVNAPLQSKEIQNIYKINYKEKHGVEHPSQDIKIQQKKWETKRNNHFEIFKTILSKRYIFPKFDIEFYKSYPREKEYIYFCSKCNSEFILQKSMTRQIRCPNCMKSQHTKPEYEIINFIKSLNIENIKQGKRFLYYGDTSFPKELDIYLPDNNFAIEVDGLYWHSTNSKNYHLEKTEACEKEGIQLIHITDSEWELKQDICKSIIKQYLNKTDTTIYARDCVVQKVDNITYQNFCENNHIQGFTPAKYRLGLYHNNVLIQIASFGKSRFVENETELLRSCTLLNTRIVGGLSKLISYFTKTIKIDNLVTYCDRRWFSGKSYLSTGWELISKTKPNYWYFSLDEYYLQNRIRFQKHKLPELLEEYDPNLSEKNNMEINGYMRFYDCGSLKFKYNI